LLKPGQEGFSVLGQAYLQTRVADEINLRIYRQILDLPYINQDDSRMVPNTFEAYTLNGESVGHFDFIISHVAKMKTRNASTFRPMSEIAGFPGTDKGLTLGGLTYSLSDDIYVGAINQYSWDLWNTAYTEAAGVWDIADGTEIGLTVQYTDQRDVGDALDGDKPNILVIWGDDIGVHNISAYNHGIMGYKTPNIDRIAKRARCSPIPTRSRAAPPVAPRSSLGSTPSAPAC
jgi:hypothetical protein